MRQAVLELYQRKRPWFLAIGLLLLLNISALAGILLFQQPALDQKQELAEQQQKSLAALDQGDASAVYRTGKKDLEKLQALIPPKRGFAPLLGQIMDLSAQCRLSTDALTYKPAYLGQRKLLVYTIALSVSGRYSAIRCFLYKMQTKKELVVIDSITFANENPYAENVTMKLQLTAYLRDGA